MSTAVRQRVDAPVWQVTRPARPGRVPGVVLAGLRDLGPAPVDHRLDPHPVLTLALACGEAALGIDESTGRQHRGSLVTGLGFGAGGAARVRAANVEWMQVRLSPAIARAVLGWAPLSWRAPWWPWTTCGESGGRPGCASSWPRPPRGRNASHSSKRSSPG
ncbi:hypothetical protein [Streptomyces sp. 4N124]|uniref:hypothetical protein n=1 Tax=Streptomyces sp. 4N124 TaxID=3457420 RepID=UPI003FD4F8CA